MWPNAAGTQADLINSGRVAQARISDLVKDLKHPMTAGQITDDVSQRICAMYHSSTIIRNVPMS